MTIHEEHPFATPEGDRDPARRLRGRLGGTVTLWTAEHDGRRAGLTVSSLMVAAGEPARVLTLLDPDADLTEVLLAGGRCVLSLLRWEHRGLADMFAGTAPAPGGAFRHAGFTATDHGPRLTSAPSWAGVVLEQQQEVGWSTLVTCRLETVTVGEEDDLLGHYRGRYQRVG